MTLNPLQRAQAWIKGDGTPEDSFAEIIEELIREVNDMTTNAQLINVRPAAAGPTAYYTAPLSKQGGKGTIITQFAATDPAATATYSVYIGLTAIDATKVLSSRTALADGDSPTSIINAFVKPGDSIFLEVSANDTIVFHVSGTEKR